MSKRHQQRRVVLAIILTGYLLVLIDVSILMAALPSIRADLGFSDTSLSWAQNAYTLTFGGLLLLGARVGDLLGRRRAFVLGIGVFTRRLASRRPGAVAGWDDRRPRRAGHRRRHPGAVDAGAAVDELPRGRAALARDGRLRCAGRHRHRRGSDHRRRADRDAVVALRLPAQRADRPGSDRRRPPLPRRDRSAHRPARRSRSLMLDPRSRGAGVRHRPLRRRRLGRPDRPSSLWRSARAHRGLRHRSGARHATADAAAPVRRSRPRRRLRRPLSLQRRAGQLLLLHDSVPPGRQRTTRRCRPAWPSSRSRRPPSPPRPSPRG